MAVTIEQLVKIDRKMNDALAELQAQMDNIESQREEVRASILELMKEQGVDSVRTAHGTVSKTVKDRFWTNDWASMHAYILENGAVDLLEKRIQQTNMREWIDTHPDSFPPGLNVDRSYTLRITKPRTTNP